MINKASLLILLGVSSAAIAQTGNHRPAGRPTTGTVTPLISSSQLQYNGSAFAVLDADDSTTYQYSGTRGGDPEHTEKYDTSVAYRYIAATSLYGPAARSMQTFDASNNISTLLVQTWNIGFAAWALSQRASYTYDGSNNLIMETRQSFDLPTSTWNNLLQFLYIYDGTNHMLSKTTQAWGAGAWLNYSRIDYTYNAAHDNTMILNSNWGGSAWDTVSVDTLAYDASHNALTDVNQTYDLVGLTYVLDLYSKTIYSDYVGNQPQLMVQQLWTSSTSTFDNTTQTHFTYNDNNQLTYSYNETFSGGVFHSAVNDYAYRYHYQDTVATTTHVAAINNNGNSLNIYPVPAGNNMDINLTWNEAQAFTISIYNVAGTQVYQHQQPVAAQYHGSIATAALPAGNYLVKIQGTKGLLQQKLVVSH